MKRKWLYVGVGVAALLQTFIEWLWAGLLFRNPYTSLPSNQFSPSQIPFAFLSKTAFALVMGFFYLHVPDEKRSIKAGATIGAILGLLIGAYQSLDWRGMAESSFSTVALEIVKSILLSAIGGIAISFAEAKMNRRNK